MGFLDWIRGGKKEAAPPSPPSKTSWIEAGDNPFGVRLLDLRPVTQGMISTSKDPANATRAISWGPATVDAIGPFEPGADAIRIPCALAYPIAPSFPDGLLYAPAAMEQKWALFHRAGSIVAIRSWTGQVMAVGSGAREGERLVLRELTTVNPGLGSLGDPVPTFDWLVRTHVLRQELPLPCTDDGLATLAESPLIAFSLFGDRATTATAGRVTPPEPPRPLRVWSAVFQAARTDDAARVRDLLAGGADPDTHAPDGYVALHVAVLRKNGEVMRALLDGRADPNASTDHGLNALGLGIVHGAPMALVEQLAAAGGDLRMVNHDGFGLLHAAAEVNRADAVEWLVRRGLALELRTKTAFTPLHIACGLEHGDAARALLAAGADPDAPSSKGTPRELAAQAKDPTIVASFPTKA